MKEQFRKAVDQGYFIRHLPPLAHYIKPGIGADGTVTYNCPLTYENTHQVIIQKSRQLGSTYLQNVLTDMQERRKFPRRALKYAPPRMLVGETVLKALRKMRRKPMFSVRYQNRGHDNRHYAKSIYSR